jgi:hypothetical protein
MSNVLKVSIPEFVSFKEEQIENNITKIKIKDIHIIPYRKIMEVKAVLNDKIEGDFDYDRLQHLILNSTMINGEFECNCKFVSFKNGHYQSYTLLLDVNSAEYKKYYNQANSTPYIHKNIIGDIFTADSELYVVYLGKVKYQRDNIKFDHNKNFIKNEISFHEDHLLLNLKENSLNKPFESLYKSKSLQLFSDVAFTKAMQIARQDKNCIKMDIPKDHLKMIADYYYTKTNNTLKKFALKEYKISSYELSHKIKMDTSLANINEGGKTIDTCAMFL